MVAEHIALAFSRASWSSIFAGGVTAFALSILMAVLGIALGFAVVHPKTEHPTSGLGVTFGVWSFVSIVVSMAGGGFIAGLFAGLHGSIHGFLVWALVLLVASLFGSCAVGSAIRAIVSAVKSVGAGAAGMASSVGKEAAHAASGVLSELHDNIRIHLNAEKLTDEMASVLRDTGIEKLQPEYLHQQMREARMDLRSALHQLSLKPTDYERIIATFLDTEKSRLEVLAGDADREAAVSALMKVRHVPEQEAEIMVDNAISAFHHALGKGRESLAEAKAQVEEARGYLKDMADLAREKADKWANTAAKTALAATIALIVAAFISMGAGMWGARYSMLSHLPQQTYYMR